VLSHIFIASRQEELWRESNESNAKSKNQNTKPFNQYFLLKDICGNLSFIDFEFLIAYISIIRKRAFPDNSPRKAAGQEDKQEMEEESLPMILMHHFGCMS
jgi:hypothetical protein